MGSGERGWPFVAGMIAVLCTVCILAALSGVPAATGLSLGLVGMLLGIGAARTLVQHEDWGLSGKTALLFVAIGGVFFWGVYLGFWPAAVSRLTEPAPPSRGGV